MKLFITAAFALSLLASPAFAASNDYYHSDNSHNNYNQNNDQNDNQNNNQYRHDNNRHHSWRHGERLTHGGGFYTTVDWRSHRLHHPSYGYQWVYVDGQYLLIDRNGFVIEVGG